MNRTFWALCFATVCAVGFVSLVSAGVVGRFCPDVTVEKYTVVAALGGDPYAPMNELVEGCHPTPAPRTPATFLLNAPLLLVADGALLWVMVPMVAAFIVAVLWAGVTVAEVDERWALIPLGALVLSPHYSGMMVHYASPTMAAPTLIAVAWAVIRRPRLAGFLLGAAAAIKLWPAIVIVALVARADTRRVGWWAVGSGAVFTLGGLLLPGVTVSGTVGALVEAGGFFTGWDGNWSLTARFGVWGAVVGLGVFGWSLRGGVDRRFGGAVVGGLLLSPLVWAYYWLAALPAVILLGRRVIVGRPVDTEEVEQRYGQVVGSAVVAHGHAHEVGS